VISYLVSARKPMFFSSLIRKHQGQACDLSASIAQARVFENKEFTICK